MKIQGVFSVKASGFRVNTASAHKLAQITSIAISAMTDIDCACLFNLPLETEPKMKTTIQLLMGSLLAVAAVAAQAEVTQIKVWAAACANCHGTNGQSQPGMESLAGKDKAELAQKMLDFKAGRKPATIMHQLSKGYTDEQIQQLAAHFAALPKKQ